MDGEGAANALILMGKAPVPGRVKTRLCPPLSPGEAAVLYSCLLADAAGEMAALRHVRLHLFYAPAEGRGHFRTEPFSAFRCLPQRGQDLGERMTLAFEEVFDRGSRRVVMVGADCPALSASRVRAAFTELEGFDGAVFGPSRDGGFYLIGLSAHAPSLFRGVAWSTPSVLSEVTARCRRAGMAYAFLPVESDVDTAQDVAELRGWARTHAAPACPRTRRWLAECLTSPGKACARRREG